MERVLRIEGVLPRARLVLVVEIEDIPLPKDNRRYARKGDSAHGQKGTGTATLPGADGCAGMPSGTPGVPLEFPWSTLTYLVVDVL